MIYEKHAFFKPISIYKMWNECQIPPTILEAPEFLQTCEKSTRSKWHQMQQKILSKQRDRILSPLTTRQPKDFPEFATAIHFLRWKISLPFKTLVRKTINCFHRRWVKPLGHVGWELTDDEGSGPELSQGWGASGQYITVPRDTKSVFAVPFVFLNPHSSFGVKYSIISALFWAVSCLCPY